MKVYNIDTLLTKTSKGYAVFFEVGIDLDCGPRQVIILKNKFVKWEDAIKFIQDQKFGENDPDWEMKERI